MKEMNMNKASNVKTPIPGPKSREYIEKWHSFEANKTGFQAPVAIQSGRGAVLKDVDGNTFIDWTSGVLVANVGHCHPKLVQAIQTAANTVLNCYEYPTPQRVSAAEALVRSAPLHLDTCFFLCTGAEATEAAVKIMKKATGCYEIIGFFGGFHGRTHNAASVGGMLKAKKGYGPAVPGVIRLPFPYCYRCPFSASIDSCGMMCIDYYDQVILANSTGSIAGIIVEPYLGTAGFIFPPSGWLKRLEAWAKDRGFLFTLDEVQSSFGRTGTMWAMEWEDSKPDIVAVGKGIGSGITTSAILLTKILLEHIEPGDLGSTNGGTPISTAACSAVLQILMEDRLVENSQSMGEIMKLRLQDVQEKSSILGDVRGKGLVLGLELVKDKISKEPAPEQARELVLRCAEKGLLIGIVGSCGNVIRVAPPLVITEEQVHESLDILEGALLGIT